ncbi:MAG: tyrosine-type recombinase/integrase [Rhodospirillales bacterium]|nr:tyrosine-type recombinase/integrase [Rhodospirillales bacterium]
MSQCRERTISKRTVDALFVDDQDAVFWDRNLQGFGVRVYPSGRKVYVVQTRGPGGSKRVTLGRHGDITADEARKSAAGIIDRIKTGQEPVPAEPEKETGPTVADLAERFMRAHVAINCKPATAVRYGGLLRNSILPVLGSMPLGAVERRHVADLHHALRDRPSTANRSVDILKKMFSLAAVWGLHPQNRNPCRSVRKYKERKPQRFLSAEEYQRLGRVLDEAEAEGTAWRPAIAALRLLILTGCRRNEILSLRWDDVDRSSAELRLRDAKTGGRMVPLTPTAAAVLDAIPRMPGNPWVIAGKKPGKHLRNVNDLWYRLREQSDLEDVRLHDLRHSWASRALALGESLPMIGRQLGHTQVQTTARYAHLAQDTERVSAARVAGSIEADIMVPRAKAA